MFRKINAAAAAAILALTAGVASAAPINIDFVAESNGVNGGVGETSVSGRIESANWGNIGITFSSTSGFAYFDSGNAQTNAAGLGECYTDTTSCGGRDNVQNDIDGVDDVTIAFDNAVNSFYGLMFNKGGHNPFSAADSASKTLLIKSDLDLDFVQYTFDQAMAKTFFGITSLTFKFDLNDDDTGRQFYIGAATVNEVPLPAAGLMLLAGLGGLAVTRARRKG